MIQSNITTRIARRRKFVVVDYSNPGAGIELGRVWAHTWNEAFAKAERTYPGRVLHVGSRA